MIKKFRSIVNLNIEVDRMNIFVGLIAFKIP